MAKTYSLTAADRQAVRDAAGSLGIDAGDLMTAIRYETNGTFNPGIIGGAGNRYQGLIQFGKAERAQYGVVPGMSFADQMRGPVVAYLKDRGVQPGMNFDQLYTAINYGNIRTGKVPYGFKDGSGRTLAQNIATAKAGRAQALAALNGSGAGGTQQPSLHRGDYKNAVADWQNNLNALGFGPLNADGKFGKQTEQATKAFQTAFGLNADGVVGNQTREAANSFAAMRDLSAPLGGTQVAGMGTAPFGFGPRLPPAALFPSGGPTPPASIPAAYAGNGPGRSPTGPAPFAMSPTLGTKDDAVSPTGSDNYFTATQGSGEDRFAQFMRDHSVAPEQPAYNPFASPQPWGAVADQSPATLAARLPAVANSPGFGIASSQGNYLNIPNSAWSGDTGTISNVIRTPQGMPALNAPSIAPFGFAQAGGAGSVLNGADVSGGRNIALMGRAPVNMANASPASTTTPEQMRAQSAGQGFGNFLRSVGGLFGGGTDTAQASTPPLRSGASSAYGPRPPMAPASSSAPATITPQEFQRRFAPMGYSSIPQDTTYRVASLAPVAAPTRAAPSLAGAGGASGVASAPSVAGVTFGAPAPTSKLAPSPFALGGAADGALASSPAPLGASLANAGGIGVGVPQQPVTPTMTPMRKVARVAVPLAASAVFGPVAGLAARGIMGLLNGGPLAQRVGQAISYANAAPRSNPYASSPFTPMGFTAPNFNPTSGGSTYAYRTTSPGVGTYINSAGRTLSYNVNADQRVYGR